jgi:hypothetical protein
MQQKHYYFLFILGGYESDKLIEINQSNDFAVNCTQWFSMPVFSKINIQKKKRKVSLLSNYKMHLYSLRPIFST